MMSRIFPKSTDDLYDEMQTEEYANRPIDLFFELYVVDVIGLLPDETKLIISEFLIENKEELEVLEPVLKCFIRDCFSFSNKIDREVSIQWKKDLTRRKGVMSQEHSRAFAKKFVRDFYVQKKELELKELVRGLKT